VRALHERVSVLEEEFVAESRRQQQSGTSAGSAGSNVLRESADIVDKW
jgi:hypothetical protein